MWKCFFCVLHLKVTVDTRSKGFALKYVIPNGDKPCLSRCSGDGTFMGVWRPGGYVSAVTKNFTIFAETDTRGGGYKKCQKVPGRIHVRRQNMRCQLRVALQKMSSQPESRYSRPFLHHIRKPRHSPVM